jgi:hypothetical protein
MIIKNDKVFIPLPVGGLEDIESISGKLVKNGHGVERAKVKIGKSFVQGIEVTINQNIKELSEEDE